MIGLRDVLVLRGDLLYNKEVAPINIPTKQTTRVEKTRFFVSEPRPDSHFRGEANAADC